MVLGALLLGMLTAAEPVAAESGAPLAVMSFNVRYAMANDGENAWPLRKDILIDTIKQFEPDIVGTQECLEMQAEYIAGKLPEYRWFGVPRSSRPLDEMTAVFYKKNALDPIETGTFWLSATPEAPGSKSWDSSLPRIATWAKFLHKKTGQILYYYNTHFDHRGPQAREESARLLLQHIAGRPAESPVILTGDFNTPENSAPWKTLTEGGLQDAWLAAPDKSGPEGTFHNFRGLENAGAARIDWLLFRGNLTVQRMECVTFNKAGKYPSDHFPLIGNLVLAPAPAPISTQN